MLKQSCVVVVMMCGTVLGQASKPAKPAFEVVSIKPTGEFDVSRIGGSGTNASGYFARGLPLSTTLMMAYFPAERMGRPWTVLGLPSWVDKEGYDIEAKFDPSTAEEWQHLTKDQQGELIRPLLQAMLAERCKMKAHVTMVAGPADELLLARHGPKLKETRPNEPPPKNAWPIAGGGMIVPGSQVTFYRTSMAALAMWLSQAREVHVVDRTGLTGTYDFVIPAPVRRNPTPPASGEASDPAYGGNWLYDLSGLGLELRPGKAPDAVLAVDHIEEPTPN